MNALVEMLFSVLADAHFPSSSICKDGPTEVRADGKEHLILYLIFVGLMKTAARDFQMRLLN